VEKNDATPAAAPSAGIHVQLTSLTQFAANLDQESAGNLKPHATAAVQQFSAGVSFGKTTVAGGVATIQASYRDSLVRAIDTLNEYARSVDRKVAGAKVVQQRYRDADALAVGNADFVRTALATGAAPPAKATAPAPPA